jgi:hypothetical protein
MQQNWLSFRWVKAISADGMKNTIWNEKVNAHKCTNKSGKSLVALERRGPGA